MLPNDERCTKGLSTEDGVVAEGGELALRTSFKSWISCALSAGDNEQYPPRKPIGEVTEPGDEANEPGEDADA